jgi:hypothetical protein
MIEQMIGLTMSRVENINSQQLVFKPTDGFDFYFCHHQDCCEFVYIEDICGDLSDLVGEAIVQAEIISNAGTPKYDADSYTWTFYKFATIKGSVTVRWLGTSNGYYSESVSLMRMVIGKNNSILTFTDDGWYLQTTHEGHLKKLTLNEFLENTDWSEDRKIIYKLTEG